MAKPCMITSNGFRTTGGKDIVPVDTPCVSTSLEHGVSKGTISLTPTLHPFNMPPKRHANVHERRPTHVRTDRTVNVPKLRSGTSQPRLPRTIRRRPTCESQNVPSTLPTHVAQTSCSFVSRKLLGDVTVTFRRHRPLTSRWHDPLSSPCYVPEGRPGDVALSANADVPMERLIYVIIQRSTFIPELRPRDVPRTFPALTDVQDGRARHFSGMTVVQITDVQATSRVRSIRTYRTDVHWTFPASVIGTSSVCQNANNRVRLAGTYPDLSGRHLDVPVTSLCCLGQFWAR